LDEKGRWKEIQKGLRQSLKPMQALLNLKLAAPDFPDQLSKLRKRLPAEEVQTAAFAEIREMVGSFAGDLAKHRLDNFRTAEAGFVEQMKEAGASIRETGEGWRIGPVLLELNREQGRARCLYNQQVLTVWKSVSSPEALAHAVDKGMRMLEKSLLPPETFQRVLGEAHTAMSAQRQLARKHRPESVPIKDLYVEFRIQLVRDELSKGSTGKRLKYSDFPIWAFLHNLDVLKRDSEKRLFEFLAGSQAEVQRGLGLVTGGLNPEAGYRTSCFVAPTKRQANE